MDGRKVGQKDGHTEGQTDELIDGTDKKYIPLWHTSYAGDVNIGH